MTHLSGRTHSMGGASCSRHICVSHTCGQTPDMIGRRLKTMKNEWAVRKARHRHRFDAIQPSDDGWHMKHPRKKSPKRRSTMLKVQKTVLNTILCLVHLLATVDVYVRLCSLPSASLFYVYSSRMQSLTFVFVVRVEALVTPLARLVRQAVRRGAHAYFELGQPLLGVRLVPYSIGG